MRTLRYVCLSACFSAAAFAGNVCATLSLTSYLAPGFSCTIGDKTFDNFDASLSAISTTGVALPTSLSDITVAPSGNSLNPGFSFEANYLASSSTDLASSTETFRVSFTGVAPGSDPFTSASMSLSNAQASSLGTITAAEALCMNGSFSGVNQPLDCSSGSGSNLSMTSQITDANLGATVTSSFSPVTQLGVVKQIELDTSMLGGSASASALNNSFSAQSSPIPEPGTLALAFGALGLVLCGRRRRRV